MARLSTTAKKLQSAINQRTGAKLLINTSQWYSTDKNRTVTVYTIKQSVQDENGEYKRTMELFKTYSQVQMVLWLRDYWYELNGWEIPHDNETWEEIKDANFQTQE